MSGDDVVLAAFIVCAIGGGALWMRLVRRHAAGPRRVPALLVAANLSLLGALAGLLLSGAEVYFRFVYDRTDAFGLMKTTEAIAAFLRGGG